jgi:RNA polymerase sigma factor (TIGR02999 family)
MSDSLATDAGIPADALFDEVYDRLKAMAGSQRARSGSPQTLGTTELVHELYIRMGLGEEKRFQDPVQFFAYAARAMRNILINAARTRAQVKSGGEFLRVSMTDPLVANVEVDITTALQLDAALQRLERDDARAAQVVELHYFGGLGLHQIADLIGVARRTVDRDWRYARAFLMAQIDSA